MTAIGDDDRAYRRGVVFGFTVAEVVLLLVFCLLLLFVPLLLGEKATKQPTSDPPYVRISDAAPSARDGRADTQRGSAQPSERPGSPRKEGADAAQETANGAATRGLGDPTNPQSSAQTRAAPLPEGWIRVAPDAATAAPDEKAGKSPSSQQATKAPTEALPLESVCAKLGIAAGDCTVNGANEKLRSLGRHNWPPIIKLKEADGEFFGVGSAQVSPALEAKIRNDVVPRIAELVKRFDTDVVEIVGHTDEQRIPPGIPSTLDTSSLDVINKGESAARLIAADNAGLGFARALAIVQILKKEDSLKNLTIVPLSAAQVIDVDGKLSQGQKTGDVKERRRIELRVRQSATSEQ